METKQLIAQENPDYNSLGNVNPVHLGELQEIDVTSKEDGQNDGVCVTWKDITATVTTQPNVCFSDCRNGDVERKTILNKGPTTCFVVSGIVQPGTHMTFIGSSGSGKTTLFNVLNHRNLKGMEIGGEVRYNGEIVGKNMSNFSAYIQQEDIFMGGLTVQEHMWFYASLLLDKQLSKRERQQMINRVLAELNLKKCRDTVIGVPGATKGLSGGEKKRLAFATAVLTRPRVIFCDEPTSGLDAYMAMGVVQVLTDMANKGRTILSTLHQPSSEIFDMMDQLYVMSEGRTVYTGPARSAVDYFDSVGLPCPMNYNPADHIVFQIAIDRDYEEESRAKIQVLCDVYEISDEYHCCKEAIQNQVDQNNHQMSKRSSLHVHKYEACYWWQLYYLLWRCYKNTIRKKHQIPAKIIHTAASGFILGLLYLGQPMDQGAIRNVSGALFLAMAQLSFSAGYLVIQTFDQDRLVFLREYHNKMYSAFPFFISRAVVDISIFAFTPLVFFLFSYWMIGLSNKLDDIVLMVLGGSAFVMCSVGLCHCWSGLVNSMTVKALIVPSTFSILLQFVPILMADTSRLVYLEPLQFISPFTYVFNIWTYAQWRHVDEIACGANVTQCWSTGLEVIEDLYGINIDHIPYDFGLLLLLFLVFEVIGAVAFTIRARCDR